MSYEEIADRDSRILKALMGVVLAALVGTIVVVLLGNHERGGSLTAAGAVTSPSIHQAPWKTRVFPAGAFGGVTKHDMKTVHSQAGPVTQVIERSLDALVLDPPSAKDVLRHTFTAPAADQILSSKFGAPQGASDLRTTTRAAKIGIQSHGAKAAAAKVHIAFTTTLQGQTKKVAQSATLWLRRAHKAWQVIGFDVDQGPLHKHSHHGSGSKGKHHKSGDHS